MGADTLERFTDWYPWERRRAFPGMQYRGIYIICQNQPELSVREVPEAIIYVGETHGASRSLRKRLVNFNRSGSTGVKGHAGGVTYHESGFDPAFQNIWFAVYPCDWDNPILNTALIYHIERELIWKYADKYGRLPACNSI